MLFEKLQYEDAVVGDKAIMLAPWTSLPPKRVIIFGIDDDSVRVITDGDTLYAFPRESMQLKTETGYSWELKKYDEGVLNSYRDNLQDQVTARKFKKELRVILDNILERWDYVSDLDKMRKIITLMEIALDEVKSL